MIYVYAICDAVPTPPTLQPSRGFDDAPVRATAVDPGVAAVYQRLDRRPRPDRDSVRLHEGVVEAAMRDVTVLPARFGTVLRDEAALGELLSRNRDRLAAGLDKVRGCVEMGVRALWVDGRGASRAKPVQQAFASGRAFLEARADDDRRRREREAGAKEIATKLHSQFLPLARDGTYRTLPAPAFPMVGAYLVPDENVPGFRVEVERLAAAGVRLLCTGPWPPYHFVPELALPAPSGEVPEVAGA